MKLWTISLFDPTPYDKVGTQRFMYIANEAERRGHKVTHFTSTFRHTTKKHRFDSDKTVEISPNFSVDYIRSSEYEKNISIKRFFSHQDFAKKLIAHLKTKPKPDVIFISMPPLSSPALVTKWARKNGIPVVVDIIDPWPDSFIKDVPQSIRPISKIFLMPFYNRLRRILEASSVITSISNGYLDWASSHCSDKKEKICFYPGVNYSEVQNKLKEQKNKYDRDESILRIIYVGSLGSSYDISIIIKAARILESRYPGKTEFVIAGSGPKSEFVKEQTSILKNLKYLGWISEEEKMKQYYLSDLGLIQHKNNLTQTVTYKLFSYLSAGLPILNSLQSEMVDIINDNDVGMNNMNGDCQALADNIESFLVDRNKLEQFKKNAFQLTKEKGDARVVYSKLVDYLERLSNA